jgi:hypothetical protein
MITDGSVNNPRFFENHFDLFSTKPAVNLHTHHIIYIFCLPCASINRNQ